jgi:hypothetical protein
MRAARILTLLLLLLPSCATGASEDRRAYILAHPHGWIELTISDDSIPKVPVDEPDPDTGETWVRPARCGVEILTNQEPFLYDHAYPNGSEAPYRAVTGFRFPAATGATKVHLTYHGCRLVEGRVADLELDAEIAVEEGRTHEILFDGRSLLVHPARPSSVVTLEDIYEVLTGRRTPAK